MLFLISLLMLFSFSMLMAGSAFKWVGNSRLYEIFDSVVSFGNYPRSIFSKAFQTIISYIMPIAAIGFLPASVLLGKRPEGIMITCIVCVFFVAGSALFWKSMLRQYTSAGG
jgi:ABC-2 type transport system permease protein